MQQISIQPFKSEDQQAVKHLIQTGLGEHWGTIDETLNPDLNDIGASYAQATFLVAWCDGRIVGTGALTPRPEQCGEIVRMSVAADMRRQGVATQILDRLCQEAGTLGFKRLILETTSTWHEVIAFYEAYGFRITHRQQSEFGEDTYFALDLDKTE